VLNLASFVTTIMERPAEELMQESIDVNFVDAEEYPSSTKIANRCVSMLAGLFHSPAVDEKGRGDAVGTPSVGSSEAIMLCGLAMKKRWKARRAAEGLGTSTPNLVMGSETHVCWVSLLCGSLCV
jgi:glutamate decarboxylase